MALQKSCLAYGSWWSTPFVRWQGSLASEHSIKLAAKVARGVLDERGLNSAAFDGISLGISVGQKHSFYGAPWLAGMIGLEGVTGPTLSQACATSARQIASAALQVEAGFRSSVLAVACDRTSNGPRPWILDTRPGS